MFPSFAYMRARACCPLRQGGALSSPKKQRAIACQKFNPISARNLPFGLETLKSVTPIAPTATEFLAARRRKPYWYS